MTRAEEQELLELTRENNQLLKLILRYVQHDEGNDFIVNVIANLLSNRIDGYATKGSNSVQKTL